MHSPARALEGLILDLKTRCYDDLNATDLRARAIDVMVASLPGSDLLVTCAPAHIAMGALLHAAEKASKRHAVAR